MEQTLPSRQSPNDLQHSALRGLSSRDCTERKFVTVLLVDAKGSKDLSRTIPLEEWWSMIAHLFELMSESVYQYGGWVGNLAGDGIVAVFEPLDAANGHACRACEAALWLCEAIRTSADRVRRDYGLDLSIRLGFNSGRGQRDPGMNRIHLNTGPTNRKEWT